jgi:Raf kinase inhibitor-like YbhB/YbcL family protein
MQVWKGVAHECHSAMMTLNSPAFQNYGRIPPRHTCHGQQNSDTGEIATNVPLPLAWSDVPANALSLVLIVEDKDATDENGFPLSEPLVHWVLYNIPPRASALTEAGPLPAGTLEGLNGRGQTGYLGPCPPDDGLGPHHYVHKLLALDRVIPDLGRPSKDALLAQMRRGQSRVIAQADLVGTYQHPKG